MRKFLFLIVIFYCCIPAVFAQEIDIKPFIKAWSVSDKSQTLKAEETYNYLKNNHDIRQFNQVLKQLHAHLNKDPDDRLWIRTTMFEVFGKIELAIWQKKDRPKDIELIFKCIKIASKLNDEQLKAELYSLYAELFPNTISYVFYNLKAIELQNKLGISHFVYVTNRYYNVGYGLYLNEDFRHSINYALTGLSFMNDIKKEENSEKYILFNDIIGASYFRLNLVDSAQYYYEKILDTLTKKPNQNPESQAIWLAIAKGNIGKALTIKGKINIALPLIVGYLQTSISLKSYNNVAIAQNNLGVLYFKDKAYKKAQMAYKNAYSYAIKSDKLNESVIATKGLIDVFRATKETDSAFAYVDLYQIYRDSLIQKINGGKLSTIKANLEFDSMTANLKEANEAIINQKLIRNLILTGIGLLAIIALQFYNRKMLQQKNFSATLVYEQKILTQEVNQAKSEVKKFIENIADKNKLIVNLQEKLMADNEQINHSLLNYTLVTNQEWDNFRVEFSKAYPIFLPKLHVVLPTINPGEERLATLLYLKTTNNQIANTLGISKDSVARSKRRLKQRLNLEGEMQLEDFICNLS